MSKPAITIISTCDKCKKEFNPEDGGMILTASGIPQSLCSTCMSKEMHRINTEMADMYHRMNTRRRRKFSTA